jgi:(4-O-methyl)-D-glucuronate---lignin esterase
MTRRCFRSEIVVSVLVLLQCGVALGQLPDYPDDEVAGIPVNYTEAKAGTYVLPDPLTTTSGAKIVDANAWQSQRRPELVKIFEENEYGRAPGRPESMRFEVVEKATPAFDGKAVRKQVTIHFGPGADDPAMDLLIYLPANATGPVPLLLNINFMPNNLAVDDPAVKVGRVFDRRQNKRVPAEGGRRFGRLQVLPTVERGFGIAPFNYADVDPDVAGAIQHGVRRLYLAEGQSESAADEWGTIAAWAWGISRAVDYFETDDQIDASRIAITGVSRLGKTVMWAGANDPRIAMVIASCSGEGGAALSRRDYGETIAHLVAPSRYPYQFAANYQKWAADPNQAPMDAHLLVALIAPRPLLLQTGTSDKWSDPKGEFLAAVAAMPVYELFGKMGIGTNTLPPAGQLAGDTLAFYMHDGGHGLVPSDWNVYLDFMEAHLKP